MAQHLPHGHDFDDHASGSPEAGAWWQALMASHTFRSVLAVAVVIAGIAVFAVSVGK